MARANHFGGALLRLCEQWKGRKPTRSRARSVECFLRAGYTDTRAQVEHRKDVRLCDEWYERQVACLLRAFPEVDEVVLVLAELVRRAQVPHEGYVARAVLRYWLDRRCSHCQGTRVLEGAPCPHCHGSGAASVPYGATGAQLAGLMDRAKASAERNLRRRVRRQQRERGRHAIRRAARR